MDLASVFLVALGLSADCFAVALSGGASSGFPSRWRVVRISLAFGFFQTLMTLLGWLAGRAIVGLISGYDHWAAFGLLAFIGGRMVRESFRGEDDQDKKTDITRGFALLAVAVATSIDALAVGLSFALLTISIVLASSTIGVVALVVTAAGFLAGRKASAVIGKRAEVVGGVILIAIGLRILLSHLL